MYQSTDRMAGGVEHARRRVSLYVGFPHYVVTQGSHKTRSNGVLRNPSSSADFPSVMVPAAVSGSSRCHSMEVWREKSLKCHGKGSLCKLQSISKLINESYKEVWEYESARDCPHWDLLHRPHLTLLTAVWNLDSAFCCVSVVYS